MTSFQRLGALLALIVVVSSGCQYLNRLTPARPAAPGEPLPQIVVNTKGVELKVPGRIAFSRDGNLWKLEDGVPTQLTKGGKDLQPAWSPDGTVIAYVKREQDYSDILLYVNGTGDFKPLTNNRFAKTTWVFRPTWSPDGKQLAFVSDQFGWDLGLFLMNANGSGVRRISQGESSGGVDSPTFSPDGKTIALAAFRGPIQQVWLFTIATGRWTQVTTHQEGAYDPRWSPVDDKLAYTARENKKNDIWVTDLEGKNRKRLTTDGAARAPAWSPDGKFLAWIAEHNGSFDIWAAAVERFDGEITLGTPAKLTNGIQADATSGLSWLY
ncbi:MAG: DPP IV N-terminal domain-containing protein [Dehalococcoidia bacterium]